MTDENNQTEAPEEEQVETPAPTPRKKRAARKTAPVESGFSQDEVRAIMTFSETIREALQRNPESGSVPLEAAKFMCSLKEEAAGASTPSRQGVELALSCYPASGGVVGSLEEIHKIIKQLRQSEITEMEVAASFMEEGAQERVTMMLDVISRLNLKDHGEGDGVGMAFLQLMNEIKGVDDHRFEILEWAVGTFNTLPYEV